MVEGWFLIRILLRAGLERKFLPLVIGIFYQKFLGEPREKRREAFFKVGTPRKTIFPKKVWGPIFRKTQGLWAEISWGRELVRRGFLLKFFPLFSSQRIVPKRNPKRPIGIGRFFGGNWDWQHWDLGFRNPLRGWNGIWGPYFWNFLWEALGWNL